MPGKMWEDSTSMKSCQEISNRTCRMIYIYTSVYIHINTYYVYVCSKLNYKPYTCPFKKVAAIETFCHLFLDVFWDGWMY